MQRPKVGRLNNKDIERSKQGGLQAIGQIQQLIDDGNQIAQNIEVKRIDISTGNPWTQLAPSTGNGTLTYCKLYDGSVELTFDYYGGTGVGPPAAWTQASVFTLPSNCHPHIAIQQACADSYFLTTRGFSAVVSISTAGVVGFLGHGSVYGRLRYMPKTNSVSPLACFPVNVKTRFKTPPKAVVAIRASKQDKDSKNAVSAPLVPSWRFINTSQGPTVQIVNIQGLEYDSKQKIDLVIIGDY